MSDAATPAEQPKPSRSGRLLGLVRRLIDYGRELAATLHQRAEADIRAVRHSFGTTDLALILLRIRRGLMRARALEAWLQKRAARLDAPRMPSPGSPTRQRDGHPAAPSQGKPRPAKQAAPQPKDPNEPIELPTEEELAAWVRRRPIGAVVAEICRDLGILCGHPLWREIQDAIMSEGGSSLRLVTEIIHRGSRLVAELLFPNPPPAPAGAGPP